MTNNNPKLYLVSVDMHTNFAEIWSDSITFVLKILSGNGIVNHGNTELRNHRTIEGHDESSIAPHFSKRVYNDI